MVVKIQDVDNRQTFFINTDSKSERYFPFEYKSDNISEARTKFLYSGRGTLHFMLWNLLEDKQQRFVAKISFNGTHLQTHHLPDPIFLYDANLTSAFHSFDV